MLSIWSRYALDSISQQRQQQQQQQQHVSVNRYFVCGWERCFKGAGGGCYAHFPVSYIYYYWCELDSEQQLQLEHG